MISIMNYDPEQMVKYIVWVASKNDTLLTWVRIVKFLYLADLYHARVSQGKTLSEWPWAFVHFGPYCGPAYEAVDQAANIGLINKKSYESHFEGREKYDLFSCYLDDEPKIGGTLHYYVVSELNSAIKKWGDDTGRLLDYVYFETEPMRDARPNQRLDFFTASKPEVMARFEMKKIPSESIAKCQDIISRLKKKHLEAAEKQMEREKERITSGLYDENYEKAIKQMDGEDMKPGLSDIAEIKD